MNPGPELDKIVCEAVGIPLVFCKSNSAWKLLPPVSTSPTFVQFNQIMEWLKPYTVGFLWTPSAWRVRLFCPDKRWHSVFAPTIPHAVCDAVREVVEARKEKP
jgi:hypothetical protein